MAISMEYIRRKLGWCPNADAIKSSGYRQTEADIEKAWRKEGPKAAPVPEPDAPADVRHDYKENMLLILIAVAWLFPVVYEREFLFPVMVVSAVAVYCDAQDIRAGETFGKESLFGNIVAWRPLTWGAATLVGGIIIMALYLFHRREIFTANN